MLILEAVVLGIIQGLTEFIPVSSSGHLIIVPPLLGWQDLGLGFDVALHLGTLTAVVLYFRREWSLILRGFVDHHCHRVPYDQQPEEASGRMLVPILVACIPAAIVGLLFNDFIENSLREWYWVAGALVIFAGVMLLAERIGRKKRSIGQMNYVDYLVIGAAQALALFPGVSRSGITISAGMFRDLDRAAAARFSFLLSTPIIFGAGVKVLADVVREGLTPVESQLFVVGFVSAAGSGYAAIRFLMRYLQTRTLNVFVVYRVCLAAFVALVFLTRGA